MQFRKDTSFPFFAYASQHKLDYGEVLRAAEFWHGEINHNLTITQNTDIAWLAHREHQRRETVASGK